MDPNQTMEMLQAFLSRSVEGQETQSLQSQQQQQQQQQRPQPQQPQHQQLQIPNLLVNDEQQSLYVDALDSSSFMGSSSPSYASISQSQTLNILPRVPIQLTRDTQDGVFPSNGGVNTIFAPDGHSFQAPSHQIVNLKEEAIHQLPSFESNANRGRRMLTEKEKFVLLVKILLKCLDQSNNPRLKPLVKATISECTRRNRLGDSSYTPLQEAVERRLRETVGDIYWTRAKLLCDHYCQRRESIAAV